MKTMPTLDYLLENFDFFDSGIDFFPKNKHTHEIELNWILSPNARAFTIYGIDTLPGEFPWLQSPLFSSMFLFPFSFSLKSITNSIILNWEMNKLTIFTGCFSNIPMSNPKPSIDTQRTYERLQIGMYRWAYKLLPLA